MTEKKFDWDEKYCILLNGLNDWILRKLSGCTRLFIEINLYYGLGWLPYHITSASTQGSNKPAHVHRLVRAFAACIHKQCKIRKAQNKIYTCSSTVQQCTLV